MGVVRLDQESAVPRQVPQCNPNSAVNVHLWKPVDVGADRDLIGDAQRYLDVVRGHRRRVQELAGEDPLQVVQVCHVMKLAVATFGDVAHQAQVVVGADAERGDGDRVVGSTRGDLSQHGGTDLTHVGQPIRKQHHLGAVGAGADLQLLDAGTEFLRLGWSTHPS